MFKKILVPLDGSDLSEAVLDHVVELAKCSQGQVVLLRVVTQPVYEATYAEVTPTAVNSDHGASLRAHAEGLAAWRRRPNAILAGQAMNLASLVCALFITLNLGVPGYLMGVIAILVAVVMTFVTIRMGLVWADMEDTFGHPPRGLRGAEG